MYDNENPQMCYKSNMIEKTNEQIQSTLANLREEVERLHQSKEKQENNEVKVDASVEQERQRIPVPEAPQHARLKPLVYFSYPILGYQETPVWVAPLQEALSSVGYLVYSPRDQVGRQFGKPDLPYINALEKRLTKSLCSVLSLPENLLLPYETIASLILAGDQGDQYGQFFKHLWFLVRSSVVVTDLPRPTLGAETHELLYAKQLGIPTIGVLPDSGHLSPWIQRSMTVLLTAEFNLNNMLPLIRGYAPL